MDPSKLEEYKKRVDDYKDEVEDKQEKFEFELTDEILAELNRMHNRQKNVTDPDDYLSAPLASFQRGLKVFAKAIGRLASDDWMAKVDAIAKGVQQAGSFFKLSTSFVEEDLAMVSNRLKQDIIQKEEASRKLNEASNKKTAAKESAEALEKANEKAKDRWEEAKDANANVEKEFERKRAKLEKLKAERDAIKKEFGFIGDIVNKISGLETKVKRAKEDLRSAEDLTEFRYQEYKGSMKLYRQSSDHMHELNAQIDEYTLESKELETLLVGLKKSETKLVEVDADLKKSVVQLSSYWGRYQALQDQTVIIYSIEPFIEPLKELLLALKGDPDQPLFNASLDFRAIEEHARKLAETKPNKELDFFF